jgi:hypothetical protein
MGMLRLSALIITSALGLAAAAAAGTRPSLVVVPAIARPGESIVVRGSSGSCPVGDTVTVISRAFPRTHEFAGVPAVLARVRSNHRFRATTRIPTRKPPRTYWITARCGGGNLGVSARLRVRR